MRARTTGQLRREDSSVIGSNPVVVSQRGVVSGNEECEMGEESTREKLAEVVRN